MSQQAADKILKRLLGDDHAVARHAVNDMSTARFDTMDRVLRAIDAGSPVDVRAVADMLSRYRIHKRLQALYPLDESLFTDDNMFTTARFVLFTNPTFSVSATTMLKLPAVRDQMRRMLRAGRLTYVDLFTQMAFSALLPDINDPLLTRDILAHRNLNRNFDNPGAFLLLEAADHSDIAYEFVRKNLAAILQRQNDLFLTLWLPEQLSKSEWAGIKNTSPALLRELYAAEYAAGYEGYVRYVAAQRAMVNRVATV